jgi:hypothetical protein
MNTATFLIPHIARILNLHLPLPYFATRPALFATELGRFVCSTVSVNSSF